jgi:predicted alpha/beta superfamily hydrolase
LLLHDWVLIVIFTFYATIMAIKMNEATEVRVILLVTVPTNTPSDANIYIIGNHRQLGSWTPPGTPLTKVAANQYQISLTFNKATYLEFKFSRGEWNTIEKDSEFYESANRTLYIKKPGVFHLKVENWADQGVPSGPKKHTWIGNIVEHRNFHARKLNNYRTIWVYLPPDYHTSVSKNYPVLYAHDGNNVFDRATAFLGIEWELDDTAERLIHERRLREIIIVAIQNTPQREAEYTHVYMPRVGGGKAQLYADFIINDLKPFIDKTYRTLKDRQYTAIMGSSLGGLVSLYIAWKYWQVFSMAGVVSPSVWWADRDIVRMVERSPQTPPLKIWLDMGTLEGKLDSDTDTDTDEISYAVRDARMLRDALIKKGFRLHHDLEYLEIEGAQHNEAAWAKRVDKILLYFFGAKQNLWGRVWNTHRRYLG